MLPPNLDQKAVPQHGPRLLPRLIVRPHRGLMEGRPLLGYSGAGRPSLISDPEILTLAILAQWSRFRSERDFWRFARAHLRQYFPALPSQSQFNRRVRALEFEMRSLQLHLAELLTEESAVYPTSWTPP
jgi:hypothetical protein